MRTCAAVVLSLAALLPVSAAAQGDDPYLQFLLARRLEQDGDVKGAQEALERAASAGPPYAGRRHRRQRAVHARSALHAWRRYHEGHRAAVLGARTESLLDSGAAIARA